MLNTSEIHTKVQQQVKADEQGNKFPYKKAWTWILLNVLINWNHFQYIISGKGS